MRHLENISQTSHWSHKAHGSAFRKSLIKSQHQPCQAKLLLLVIFQLNIQGPCLSRVFREVHAWNVSELFARKRGWGGNTAHTDQCWSHQCVWVGIEWKWLKALPELGCWGQSQLCSLIWWSYFFFRGGCGPGKGNPASLCRWFQTGQSLALWLWMSGKWNTDGSSGQKKGRKPVKPKIKTNVIFMGCGRGTLRPQMSLKSRDIFGKLEIRGENGQNCSLMNEG